MADDIGAKLEEIKLVLERSELRLDNLEGTLGDFHGIIHDFETLLGNHMADYSTKFGRLRATVENQEKINTERDKVLHTKIDVYKWGLLLVASFTALCLAGFITLCIRLIGMLIGGG
jgi:hypothetical protein